MNPQIQKLEQQLVDAYTEMDEALKEAERYKQMSQRLLMEYEKIRWELNEIQRRLPHETA